MIHPILDRMTVAKRLALVNPMKFGTFGHYSGFEDDSWLDYSFYNSDINKCGAKKICTVINLLVIKS
jgi:hypothetical protein